LVTPGRNQPTISKIPMKNAAYVGNYSSNHKNER